MEFSLLQVGLMILLALIGAGFAYTEAGGDENKFLYVPGFGILGAVIGFFLYYLGIFVLIVLGIGAVLAIFKMIFGPKIVVVKESDLKANKDDLDKDIIDVVILDTKK